MNKIFRKVKSALIKVISNGLIDIIGIIISIPVILIVRLIQPLYLIRFGQIFAGRIGHFYLETENNLTEKKLGIHPKNAIDFYYYEGLDNKSKPANEFLSILTKRNMRIFSFVRYLSLANSLIPMGEKNTIVSFHKKSGSRDINGLFQQVDPQLKIFAGENKQGEKFLQKVGLKGGERFVCMIVRDQAYLNSPIYDHNTFRDSDIDTYEAAALALAKKGYWVFRMGKLVQKPFKVKHLRIIDYANSEYRSDFLDIWLMSNCFFSISSTCGLDCVPNANRIPVCNINGMPLGHINTTFNPFSIWLPKNVVWKKNKKLLTLKELINTGVIGFVHTKEYKNAKVELIDNSPGKITETVLEFEAKLTGNWQSHHQDDVLQNKFWDILKTWEQFPNLHGKLQSKMPDTFIRENHEWFLN